MTNEAQRIAIAEACGWSIHQIETAGMQDVAILPPGAAITDEGAVWKYAGNDLPDYLNSLDAMASAEKILNDEQWEIYADYLLWSDNQDGHSNYTSCRVGCEATAAQRAEAFLKTLGLWVEEMPSAIPSPSAKATYQPGEE